MRYKLKTITKPKLYQYKYLPFKYKLYRDTNFDYQRTKIKNNLILVFYLIQSFRFLLKHVLLFIGMLLWIVKTRWGTFRFVHILVGCPQKNSYGLVSKLDTKTWFKKTDTYTQFCVINFIALSLEISFVSLPAKLFTLRESRSFLFHTWIHAHLNFIKLVFSQA